MHFLLERFCGRRWCILPPDCAELYNPCGTISSCAFSSDYPALTGNKTPNFKSSWKQEELVGNQLPVEARMAQLTISGG